MRVEIRWLWWGVYSGMICEICWQWERVMESGFVGMDWVGGHIISGVMVGGWVWLLCFEGVWVVVFIRDGV